MTEPNLILITIAAVFGASGIGLVFVGMLMAVLTALGNRHYVFGIAIFLFFPVALIYGYLNRENAAYAMKLFVPGLFLLALFFGLLWWELARLGLDFFEVMATTKPQH